jgi:hypothetical protein
MQRFTSLILDRAGKGDRVVSGGRYTTAAISRRKYLDATARNPQAHLIGRTFRSCPDPRTVHRTTLAHPQPTNNPMECEAGLPRPHSDSPGSSSAGTVAARCAVAVGSLLGAQSTKTRRSGFFPAISEASWQGIECRISRFWPRKLFPSGV